MKKSNKKGKNLPGRYVIDDMLVTRRTLGVAALLTDKLQSLSFSVWTVGKEVLGTSNGFFTAV